jgi:hypothetical protein
MTKRDDIERRINDAESRTRSFRTWMTRHSHGDQLGFMGKGH